jgi:hypothetical protein
LKKEEAARLWKELHLEEIRSLQRRSREARMKKLGDELELLELKRIACATRRGTAGLH